MDAKRVALVTGANQGIGLQIGKQLLQHGFTVLFASRSVERCKAAVEGLGPDAIALGLDVTVASSIAAAAERVQRELGRLDVLINNAAISNTSMRPDQQPEDYIRSTLPSVVDLNEVRAVFETNVFGVLAVTQAMLPLLRQSPAGRIVNVSSGAASLTRMADPSTAGRHLYSPTYGASKTALSAMTVALAIELAGTTIKVNACSPGYVATNLNHYAGAGTVEEGAREPLRLALLGPEGATGTFTRWEDVTIPW